MTQFCFACSIFLPLLAVCTVVISAFILVSHEFDFESSQAQPYATEPIHALYTGFIINQFQIDDPAFALRLWETTGLKEVILENETIKDLWGGEPVGLNPNIRIYRYSKGQYFDCHYDDSNNLVLDSVPVKTTWTLLLYLTSSAEGCIGGETVFYPHDRRSAAEEIAVSLETGMLLLHKHGDDCLLHEGREVQDGEKWVLRTDLCVRRG
ncbi:hypothetical protein A0O28_0016090 [Trichoderma guizhouense]|uniref:Fe2OG dioxygenase domain-containing protein n=1 Tax=Trichoderma guizhouense TaxID=1491466 RepID=A0A1T3CBK5_9HYPO|nr:hypothetical protein A0O28_0016090 [Trichoderma guizhouense]